MGICIKWSYTQPGFKVQEGDKRENPDELTSVSDSGEKSAGADLNAAYSGLAETRPCAGLSSECSQHTCVLKGDGYITGVMYCSSAVQ